MSRSGAASSGNADETARRSTRRWQLIYIPAASSGHVLVVDASTFTVVDAIEPIDPWAVAVEDHTLWAVSENGPIAQHFDQ